MNMFNCVQAMLFYSFTPFGVQWLYLNDHTAWSIVAGVIYLWGFCLVTFCVYEKGKDL